MYRASTHNLQLGWILVLTTPPEVCDWGDRVQTYSAPASERVEEKVWKENVSLKTTWRRRAEMTTLLQILFYTCSVIGELVKCEAPHGPYPYINHAVTSVRDI